MRYALILDEMVVNVIHWDGETSYEPNGLPIQIDDRSQVDKGWQYIDGEFIPPEPEFDEPDAFVERVLLPPSVDDLQQQIIDLQQRIDALETKKK